MQALLDIGVNSVLAKITITPYQGKTDEVSAALGDVYNLGASITRKIKDLPGVVTASVGPVRAVVTRAASANSAAAASISPAVVPCVELTGVYTASFGVAADTNEISSNNDDMNGQSASSLSHMPIAQSGCAGSGEG